MTPTQRPRGRTQQTTASIERPRPSEHAQRYGSDEIADVLRQLDIPFFVCNPGASYRGLQDSLVNYLGNLRPQMLICLHEEHAVGIAQGYAKVTGKPLLVGVHANVGLMHATMAIFNAWCDRMPMVIIGATGPVDAQKRRPWIDWIHSARDQGALVRPYTKWDDQPASAAAAREAIVRGTWLAQTEPQAPVYINLDAHLQEAVQEAPLPPMDFHRLMPVPGAGVSPAAIAAVIERLTRAKHPLILIGRVSRDEREWNDRVELAERLNARVATDLKVGAAFPLAHPLHVGPPGVFPGAETAQAIRVADLIISLDWVDLAGTMQASLGGAIPAAFMVHASVDHHLHNGWSMDHQGLPVVDVLLPVPPAVAVRALLKAVRATKAISRLPYVPFAPATVPDSGEISVDDIGAALREVTAGTPVCLSHLPLSWNGGTWPFDHPLDYIGCEGGGGVGAGPSIAIGAALALVGSDRLAVGIVGDGDFLMGATALWTAVHYRIPVLIIVANNQSFFNDEIHQERVARMRGRDPENKWIGQRLTDPDIDLAKIAQAQGAFGMGPVRDAANLLPTLREAVATVRQGGIVVCDIRIKPGYAPAMANALRQH